MQDTVIKVALTRTDDYGNLWVTPEGGGTEVKIGEKRSSLFPLFQQGNTISLHWETYKNKPYVKDAKQITGEPAQAPKLPAREPFTSDPVKNASIEAQTAYQGIMNNWEKDIPIQMKFSACKWGLSKLGVTNLPKIEDFLKDYFKEASEKPLVGESAQPAQEKAALPTTESQTDTLPEFKNGTDLVNYALKHGFKLVSIKETLGIKTPADIKDVAVAAKTLFVKGVK